MELTIRRRRCINEVLFDRFVKRYVLSVYGIVSEDGKINRRFLNGLAKEIKCDKKALELSIYTSCARISNEKITFPLSIEAEEKVMLAAAKRRINGNKQPLKDYKRGFGNLAAELNKENPTLKLRVKELFAFAYPIYLEVTEEMFNS